MQINQVFDELYDDYTAKIVRWVPHYRQMVQEVASYLPGDWRAERILDLGCGNGNVTQALRQRFPEAQYHLVDASAEMLQGCRQRFAGQGAFSYEQCFFQDLDLPAASYDLIVACLSIHHLPGEEKRRFLQRLPRALRSGGYFLYSDLMIDKTATDHPAHLGYWKNYAEARGTTAEEWQFVMDHYDEYDYPASLKRQGEWLEGAGFREVVPAYQERWWTTLRCGV